MCLAGFFCHCYLRLNPIIPPGGPFCSSVSAMDAIPVDNSSSSVVNVIRNGFVLAEKETKAAHSLVEKNYRKSFIGQSKKNNTLLIGRSAYSTLSDLA